MKLNISTVRPKLIALGLVGIVAGTTFLATTALRDFTGRAEAETHPAAREELPAALSALNEATVAYSACAQAKGYTPHLRQGAGLRPGEVTFSREPSEGETAEDLAARAREDLPGCAEGTALQERQRAYLSAIREPDRATRQTYFDILESCVAEGGVPGVQALWMAYDGVAANDEIAVSAAERELYAQCALALQEETGWRAPAPATR
jgi:hypothetical protein